MLDIIVNNKRYQYIQCVKIDNTSYIAITDGKTITISEYKMLDDKIQLLPIDDKTFDIVRKEMNL